MIVRETEHDFVLIEQHEHGRLAGEVAAHFRHDFFREDLLQLDEAILATYEHDRAWIPLDAVPLWNVETDKPYTFEDYPLTPKLAAYQRGIDEVEAQSSYAGFLCSKHFASFVQSSSIPECVAFYNSEMARQTRIMKQLRMEENTEVERHFQLLQLCDDISLYISLNTPGVTKELEHPWYQDGFQNYDLFNRVGEQTLMPYWIDQDSMRIDSSLFEYDFQVKLSYRTIAKDEIRLRGFDVSYANSPVYQQIVDIKA